MRQSDEPTLLPQYRIPPADGIEEPDGIQVTHEPTTRGSCEKDELALLKWQYHTFEEVKCRKCKWSWKQGRTRHDSYCAWMCAGCKTAVCLKCLPVVLEVKYVEDPPDNTKT